MDINKQNKIKHSNKNQINFFTLVFFNNAIVKIVRYVECFLCYLFYKVFKQKYFHALVVICQSIVFSVLKKTLLSKCYVKKYCYTSKKDVF